MSGRHSRNKGAAYEREVANDLKPIFEDSRRGIGQTRSGGDVPDVAGCGPFWVECKKQARTYPRAALKQAETAMKVAHAKGQKDHFIPVAVCRDDRDKATVTMYLDDWKSLIAEWWQERKGEAGQ